jgi:uncharacterized protein YjeT (DUF2065 family)
MGRCPEQTTLTFEAEQSRVDALIRLVGIVVVLFGAIWLYLTYTNASVVASEIVTVNYALGLLLLIVGLFATLAKLK